ncbi:MAG: OmpH family outer membrane protein [Lentisphaeria bacterium]|nr:OmpH family outer membrane protein [Lentisphaeria bacterium]
MKKILFATVFAVGSIFAETVAYINMETVFNAYYKTVNENIRFEEARQNFMTGFEVLLSDGAKATAAQKAQALEERLAQKNDEIMQYRQRVTAEIESNQQNATLAIVEDLQAQVAKYAADNGIDVIYEVSGRTMNRVPVLLVYPKDKEMTDAFVKISNAGHEKEKEESQAKLASLQKAAAQKQQQ